MELLQKLRIKTDQPLWVINAPAGGIGYFDQMVVKQKAAPGKPVPQLLLFVKDSKELVHYLPLLEDNISPETLFWIFYPKKSGAITSDLIQMKTWDIVFKSGYRGQTSVSVDNDWSGMRFTSASKKKSTLGDLPMEERKVEGIDFVSRTVRLPADALNEVNKYKGAAAMFDTLSFTAKKEYVISIVEAKQTETRQRRIGKMIAELIQKMQAKPARAAK